MNLSEDMVVLYNFDSQGEVNVLEDLSELSNTQRVGIIWAKERIPGESLLNLISGRSKKWCVVWGQGGEVRSLYKVITAQTLSLGVDLASNEQQ